MDKTYPAKGGSTRSPDERETYPYTAGSRQPVFLALWTSDDLVFISEPYRVQFTLIFLVFCWTGARIGASFTDGLRYKVAVISRFEL